MKIFSSYFKIILFVLAAAIILRSLETTKVLINFGNSDSLWSSELLGLILDLCFLCICLTIAFPLYFALNKLSEKITHSAFVLLVCLFFISNFFIIEYFTYQLLPLDIFLPTLFQRGISYGRDVLHQSFPCFFNFN
jgi:ABC-type spermidine/putrescine transport system permease subunit I